MVYRTLLVMATITAGSKGSDDAGRIAGIVASTVVVFWIAHVYAHGLAESIERGRRLDWHELAEIAHRGVDAAGRRPAGRRPRPRGRRGLRVPARRWLALGIGLATLAAQGVRYAQVEGLGRLGTLAVVAINLALGLLIVALRRWSRTDPAPASLHAMRMMRRAAFRGFDLRAHAHGGSVPPERPRTAVEEAR